MDFVKVDIEDRVAHVLMSREDKHNAFDDQMVSELSSTFEALENDPDVHVVVLRGAGKHFCAGADLHWMQRMADFSQGENISDANQLANLFKRLHDLSKPVIAEVRGAVYGGGLGLVACADIVFADETARFCFSEVKLGLVPATISPYMVAAMGARQARRFMLTAETFDADMAQSFGLVSHVTESSVLQEKVNALVTQLLENAPRAMAATKALLQSVQPIDPSLVQETAHIIAHVRAGEEAQMRLKSFLAEKNGG